jgi:hypothetical protein
MSTTQAKNLVALAASLEKEQDLQQRVAQDNSKIKELASNITLDKASLALAQEERGKARAQYEELDSKMKVVAADISKWTKEIDDAQQKIEANTVSIDKFSAMNKELESMDGVKQSFFHAMTLAYIEKTMNLAVGDRIWIYIGGPGSSYALRRVTEIKRPSISQLEIHTVINGKPCQTQKQVASGLSCISWVLPVSIANSVSEAKKMYLAFFKITEPLKKFDLEDDDDDPPPLVDSDTGKQVIEDEKAKKQPVALKFPIGTVVDCLDTASHWIPAEVLDHNKTDNHYLIRFLHWWNYDAWYPECRIAPKNTHVDHDKYDKKATGGSNYVTPSMVAACYPQQPYTKRVLNQI